MPDNGAGPNTEANSITDYPFFERRRSRKSDEDAGIDFRMYVNPKQGICFQHLIALRQLSTKRT